MLNDHTVHSLIIIVSQKVRLESFLRHQCQFKCRQSYFQGTRNFLNLSDLTQAASSIYLCSLSISRAPVCEPNDCAKKLY